MTAFSPAAPRIAAPGTSRRALSLSRLADPALLLAWVLFTTTFTDTAAATIVRYLIVACFGVAMILSARQTMPVFARSWPTLVLPALCFVSAIWAPSAGEAIRKGLLMGLTGIIAIYAASRMNVRQILSVYFVGETVGAVLSALNPNLQNDAWTGIFGQKNYLAIHMFILYTTGLVIALDKGSNVWLRGSALLFIPLAAALILLSKSVTTILLLGGATAAILGHAFIWAPASRVRHARTLIAVAILALTTAAGLLLFGLFQFDAVDSLLKFFGKDSTLTGRTFIWDWGYRIMNEHPLTGVGANGFWRPDVGVANQILTYFYYEQFTKFSFHNSYLENGVQLGYPGYAATALLAAWGLWNTARTWIRNQTLLNAAFLVFAVAVVFRSMSEIDLAQELGATAVLFFIGAARRDLAADTASRPAPKFGWRRAT